MRFDDTGVIELVSVLELDPHGVSDWSRGNLTDVPTIICLNTKNGKLFQSAVDSELFIIKRTRSIDPDPLQTLWMETNVYISNLFDRCVDKMSNPTKSFPILNRNNKYGAITERERAMTPQETLPMPFVWSGIDFRRAMVTSTTFRMSSGCWSSTALIY